MIVMKNLVKVYDSDSDTPVRALNGVDLHIRRSEMVAVVGASGSGKSTLLNILGCLDQKTRGTYLLSGRDIGSFNAKELARLRNTVFGYVLQDFAIIEDWTVRENVRLPLSYSPNRNNEDDTRLDVLLDRLGLYEKKHSLARKLSGGQRQRTAIARALINDPEIILADEPTGALDRTTGLEVMNILCDIHRSGKTVIVVTHDMNVADMCSRIIEVSDGRVIEHDSSCYGE